jgi:rod shape-determining protein MreD
MPIAFRLKLLLPKLLALLFIFLSYTPSRLYGLDNFFPAVDLMMIYYWSLYKPQVMPNWFIFSIGLMKDILSGSPLGVNALSYILLRGLAMYKEKYLKKTFTGLWQGFAVFAAIVMIFKWLVFSFVFEEIMAINTVLMQFLLSVLIYPLFHSLFNGINVILPRSRPHA